MVCLARMVVSVVAVHSVSLVVSVVAVHMVSLVVSVHMVFLVILVYLVGSVFSDTVNKDFLVNMVLLVSLVVYTTISVYLFNVVLLDVLSVDKVNFAYWKVFIVYRVDTAVANFVVRLFVNSVTYSRKEIVFADYLILANFHLYFIMVHRYMFTFHDCLFTFMKECDHFFTRINPVSDHIQTDKIVLRIKYFLHFTSLTTYFKNFF